MDVLERIDKILVKEKTYDMPKLSWKEDSVGMGGGYKCPVCGKDMSRKEFKQGKCNKCK